MKLEDMTYAEIKNLTAQELRELANQKELEEETRAEEEAKPVQVGVIKHDLYEVNDDLYSKEELMTPEIMEIIIRDYLMVVVDKGTKIESWKDDDGIWWGDTAGYIETADQEWVEKHVDIINPAAGMVKYG